MIAAGPEREAAGVKAVMVSLQIRVNMQTLFDDLALTTPAPLAA